VIGRRGWSLMTALMCLACEPGREFVSAPPEAAGAVSEDMPDGSPSSIGPAQDASAPNGPSQPREQDRDLGPDQSSAEPSQCDAASCPTCLDSTDCLDGVHSQCNTVSGRCVECLTDKHCVTAEAARCDSTDHVCKTCTDSLQCVGKSLIGSLCNTTPGSPLIGSCVNCFGNADCRGNPEASRCDTTTGNCGPCATNDDCEAVDGNKICVGTGTQDHRCAECGVNADCTADPTRLVCKTGDGGNPAAARNTCVECVVNGDCKDPAAPRCEANTCVPCVNDEECSGITVGGVDRHVCDAGICVQCNGTNYTACAGGINVCSSLPDSNGSLARTCTLDAPVGSASLCQPCVADAQCADGRRCIEGRFDGSSVGYFCYPVQAPSAPLCPRPFSLTATVLSIEGRPAPVCLLASTTCEAFVDSDRVTCTGDEECGVAGLDDALCSSVTGTCTLPCSRNDECNRLCVGGVCE
jgi:hypothetical protein